MVSCGSRGEGLRAFFSKCVCVCVPLVESVLCSHFCIDSEHQFPLSALHTKLFNYWAVFLACELGFVGPRIIRGASGNIYAHQHRGELWSIRTQGRQRVGVWVNWKSVGKCKWGNRSLKFLEIRDNQKNFSGLVEITTELDHELIQGRGLCTSQQDQKESSKSVNWTCADGSSGITKYFFLPSR